MKDFIMIGTGDFSDLIADTIVNDMGRTIAGYVVDRKYLKEDTYRGIPVAAFEEVTEHFPPERYTPVIAFVGSRMYEQRYEKFTQMKSLGYTFENVIHSTASISKESQMGEGNIFLQYSIAAHNSRIGDCNVICPKAYLNHDVKLGNANYLGPGVSTTGYVEIGSNCFLGVNSSYNNKIKVADYTFVGGGIFISHDTQPYEVYAPERSQPIKRIKSIQFQVFTSRRQ